MRGGRFDDAEATCWRPASHRRHAVRRGARGSGHLATRHGRPLDRRCDRRRAACSEGAAADGHPDRLLQRRSSRRKRTTRPTPTSKSAATPTQNFPFSTASDAELLAAFQDYATPRQGCFDWFPGRRSRLEGLETCEPRALEPKASGGSRLGACSGRQPSRSRAGSPGGSGGKPPSGPPIHRFMRDAMRMTECRFRWC